MHGEDLELQRLWLLLITAAFRRVSSKGIRNPMLYAFELRARAMNEQNLRVFNIA